MENIKEEKDIESAMIEVQRQFDKKKKEIKEKKQQIKELRSETREIREKAYEMTKNLVVYSTNIFSFVSKSDTLDSKFTFKEPILSERDKGWVTVKTHKESKYATLKALENDYGFEEDIYL